MGWTFHEKKSNREVYQHLHVGVTWLEAPRLLRNLQTGHPDWRVLVEKHLSIPPGKPFAREWLLRAVCGKAPSGTSGTHRHGTPVQALAVSVLRSRSEGPKPSMVVDHGSRGPSGEHRGTGRQPMAGFSLGSRPMTHSQIWKPLVMPGSSRYYPLPESSLGLWGRYWDPQDLPVLPLLPSRCDVPLCGRFAGRARRSRRSDCGGCLDENQVLRRRGTSLFMSWHVQAHRLDG